MNRDVSPCLLFVRPICGWWGTSDHSGNHPLKKKKKKGLYDTTDANTQHNTTANLQDLPARFTIQQYNTATPSVMICSVYRYPSDSKAGCGELCTVMIDLHMIKSEKRREEDIYI